MFNKGVDVVVRINGTSVNETTLLGSVDSSTISFTAPPLPVGTNLLKIFASTYESLAISIPLDVYDDTAPYDAIASAHFL